MKEPSKSPQEGLPPVRPPFLGAREANKSDVPPRPAGLVFLIAILKKRQETGASEDER